VERLVLRRGKYAVAELWSALAAKRRRAKK
jgi:hypothetical protein